MCDTVIDDKTVKSNDRVAVDEDKVPEGSVIRKTEIPPISLKVVGKIDLSKFERPKKEIKGGQKELLHHRY